MNLRDEICLAGKRLYDRGLISGAEGNISAKDADGLIWTTPSGVCKGFMTPQMLIKVDGRGNVLEGEGKPSSELKMHLKVYEIRPDAKAAVHAHPVVATALASAGVTIDRPYLTESVLSLGDVPIAEYATPSTDEVPESIAEYIKTHRAVLLRHHGALVFAETLQKACNLMEVVEVAAKTTLIMKIFSAEDKVIPAGKIASLLKIKACE